MRAVSIEFFTLHSSLFTFKAQAIEFFTLPSSLFTFNAQAIEFFTLHSSLFTFSAVLKQIRAEHGCERESHDGRGEE